MWVSPAAAVLTTVVCFIGVQTKPQPPDRPLRTVSTRALVHYAAFAPDNVVVVWDSGGFGRWNFETGKTVARQPVIAKACAAKPAPLLPRSDDGRTLGVNCAGKLFFFDMATTELRAEWRFDPKQTPALYTLSQDGALIASVPSGATSTIQVVDAKSGEQRATIQNGQEVLQLSVASGGQLLVAGAIDGVRLWKIPDGKLLHTIPGGTFHALSPDNQMLALERGRDVVIVDVASGAVKQTLPGAVSQLRFSNNGAALVAWNNQQLTVWDLASGKGTLTLKASQLQTVALSSDAQYLVAVAMELAGAPQTTVGVWKIPPTTK